MASIDWTAKSHSAALHSEGRALEKLVEKIKERIGAAQYQGETSVREAIVLPLLQVLGWDIFDPTIVIREYTLGARRVDYALCSSPPRKDVFIEVKALRQSVGGDRQLFEYAFHEGIPFAILTDGREWNFFVPGEQGSYDERRVQKVDVVERPVTDVMQIFSRYLSFARVKSGEAIESARADYQNISKRKTAANEIPKAWGELVSEPDELLIDLIAEKAETLCGYRPAPEDVEAFLIGNLKVGVPPTMPPHTVSKVPSRSEAPAPVSERGVTYEMFGKTKHADSAIDALIDVLRTLASRSPKFIETLAPLVRGRTRNHVAQARQDVYPEKPELLEFTTELLPGWWLGTNISNRDKMRIIRKACEIEKVKFGKDVAIALPNAD